MRYRSEEAVRRALSRELGKEPDARHWQTLVSLGCVDRVIDDICPLGDLIADYKDLEGRYGQPDRTKTVDFRSTSPDDKWFDYLAELLALEAAEDPYVKSFRAEVLGGTLLEPAAVAGWIESQLSEGGPDYPTDYVGLYVRSYEPYLKAAWDEPSDDLALSIGRTLLDDLRSQPQGLRSKEGKRGYSLRAGLPDARRTYRYVHYLDANGRDKSTEVRTIGVLSRLADLARALADYYRWQETEAAMFILTGLTPKVQDGIAEYRPHSDYPSLDTLTITVHPTAPPKRLTELYSWVRKKLLPDARSLGRATRHRRKDEKGLALAVFFTRYKDKTLLERLRLWNESYPHWPYPEHQVKNFARDAYRAIKHLQGK